MAAGAVYGYVTNTRLFNFTVDSLDWIKTSGLKNVIVKPLESVSKIATRFNFPLPDSPHLNELIKLAGPAKTFVVASETLTKLLPIGKAITDPEPRKYVVNSTLPPVTGYRFLNDYNFDRFNAIANVVADWAFSCAEWAEHVHKFSPNASEEHWSGVVSPWAGRVMSFTGMWTEGKFLYQTWWQGLKQHPDNAGGVRPGTVAKEELICSGLKVVLYTMFIAMDVFHLVKGKQKLEAGSCLLEKAIFWTGQGINLMLPVAIHYAPNFLTKPLNPTP